MALLLKSLVLPESDSPVLHGVLDVGRAGGQLKQHAKPLQLASCSVLVAPPLSVGIQNVR